MTKASTEPTTRHPRPANRRAASRAAAAKRDKNRLGKTAARQSPTAPSARRSGGRRSSRRRMDEFIARGFAATRLDDIAKRAGVAKGTIYLHFKDKESMFEELIRTAIVPLVGRMQGPPPASGTVRDLDRGLCAELHPGGRDHAARRHRAADRRRRAALSGDRRLLLSRGGLARSGGHARADRARHRARRDQATRTSQNFRKYWWRRR